MLRRFGDVAKENRREDVHEATQYPFEVMVVCFFDVSKQQFKKGTVKILDRDYSGKKGVVTNSVVEIAVTVQSKEDMALLYADMKDHSTSGYITPKGSPKAVLKEW